MDRRAFLGIAAKLGVSPWVLPATTVKARGFEARSYFGLHPFLEAHPEAVFVRKTHVTSKEDSEGKKREGLRLAQQIFVLRDSPGIPLSYRFAIKPNLTSTVGTGTTHAIVTDSYAVEGLIEGMKQLGVPADRIYTREGLMESQRGVGYIEMAERTGVHYADPDSRTAVLKECPDGVVFKRTKFVGPFNYPDSYLINVAKLKTHSMGLTLCVKNLQGTNIRPYIRFCGGLQEAIAEDFKPDAQRHVDDLYAKHLQAGFPRWDAAKGAYMEMWAQRTMDSYSLVRPTLGLNIIEGVVAQNGDGFSKGPGPGVTPEIFLSNVLIFGKDPFRVDIVGHWLGGHEPGNFGMFHIARERGLSTALNPRNIPIYVWDDDAPKLTPLDGLTRTPLTTLYLPRPGESEYHLCNEPFAYPKEPVSACLSGRERPELRVLGQHHRGRQGPQVLVEYSLPRDGNACVEVYDSLGERVGVLARGRLSRGVHMAAWEAGRASSGIYVCRLGTQGYDHVQRLAVLG